MVEVFGFIPASKGCSGDMDMGMGRYMGYIGVYKVAYDTTAQSLTQQTAGYKDLRTDLVIMKL